MDSLKLPFTAMSSPAVFVFLMLIFLSLGSCTIGAIEPRRPLMLSESQSTCGTTFGRSKACTAVNATLEIGAGGFNYLTIKPNAGAFLEYSFTVFDPPDAHTTALLLNKKQLKQLEEGALDITTISTPGSVQSTEAAANITAQFIAGNNGASNEPLDTYYLVFTNADVLNITLYYSLDYTPNPIKTCLASILTVVTAGLVPVLVFMICVWREGRKRQTRGMGGDVSQSSITYKYVEPTGFSTKCGTVSFLEKKPYGFWVYWANSDDIFWICYPEVNETLSRTQRCIASVTFLFIQLFFQINWNRLISIQAEEESFLVAQTKTHDSYIGRNEGLFTGELFLQVLFLMALGALFGLLYKPFLRCVSKPQRWQDSDKKEAVILGLILNYLGVVLFVVVFLAVIISLSTLLGTYSCRDFIWGIFFPFLLAYLFRSVFPGVFTRYLFFKLNNTFGKDVRVEPVQGGFSDFEKGEDEEVRNSLLGSD